MSATSFLRRLFGRTRDGIDPRVGELVSLCESLLGERGEMSGAAVAPGAMLRRRNSSWRTESADSCSRIRLSVVGALRYASAARPTASGEGEKSFAKASKNPSRSRSPSAS